MLLKAFKKYAETNSQYQEFDNPLFYLTLLLVILQLLNEYCRAKIPYIKLFHQ